jgi:hypothetical protein
MRRCAGQVGRRHVQVVCQSRVFASSQARNRPQFFAVDLAVIVNRVGDVQIHDSPEYQPVAKSTEFDNAIKPTFKAYRRARKTRGSYDPAGGEVEPKCIDFAKLRVAFG